MLITLVAMAFLNYQNNKKLEQKINAIADMVGSSSKASSTNNRLADIQTAVDHVISTTENIDGNVVDVSDGVANIKNSVSDLYSNIPLMLGRADVCRSSGFSF